MPVVECFSRMFKALSSIPSTAKTEANRKPVYYTIQYTIHILYCFIVSSEISSHPGAVSEVFTLVLLELVLMSLFQCKLVHATGMHEALLCTQELVCIPFHDLPALGSILLSVHDISAHNWHPQIFSFQWSLKREHPYPFKAAGPPSPFVSSSPVSFEFPQFPLVHFHVFSLTIG